MSSKHQNITNISFEWAKDNKDKDAVACFIYTFCPTNTESFPAKREDWLHSLSSALLSVADTRLEQTNNKEDTGEENNQTEGKSENKISTAVRMKYQGRSTTEISEHLGVSGRTIRRWLKDVPEVQTLDTAGRLISDKSNLCFAASPHPFFTEIDIPY